LVTFGHQFAATLVVAVAEFHFEAVVATPRHAAPGLGKSRTIDGVAQLFRTGSMPMTLTAPGDLHPWMKPVAITRAALRRNLACPLTEA